MYSIAKCVDQRDSWLLHRSIPGELRGCDLMNATRAGKLNEKDSQMLRIKAYSDSVGASILQDEASILPWTEQALHRVRRGTDLNIEMNQCDNRSISTPRCISLMALLRRTL
ncbi:hypothetical protein [Dokdonella sp.]|uniref:hypothetical protein n=1 Tax=Dokdonella sp. TaxID=2291710 RepID=UPI003527FC01